MATVAPNAPETDKNPIQDEYEDGLSPLERGKLGGVYAKHQEEINARRKNLQDREESTGSASGTAGAINSDDIPTQEASPTYKTNFKPQAPTQKNEGFIGFLKANKKKGPIGAIVGLLVLGAFGISFLTPGLLLIHITETITDRLDMQGPSLKIRTSKIYAKKLSNQALSGICTQVADIRCKFNSLNERQLKSLRAAGVEIEVEEGKTITGRYKVKSMSMNGEEINPVNLSTAIRENRNLRIAMDDAYSSDFARFADAKAKSVFDRLGLKKEPLVSGKSSDEERKKAQEDGVNKKNTVSEGEGDVYKPVDENNQEGNWTNGTDEIPADEARVKNAEALGAKGELAKGIAEAQKGNIKLTDEVLDEAANVLKNGEGLSAADAAEGIGKKGLGAIGILLAMPDQACNVYGMYKTVSNGAKLQRAGQLAVFAMDFLAMGSKIKAGDATPEEVGYLANQLTKTVALTTTDTSGKEVTTTSKPATDSYGYKYAAYGDDGPLTASAAGFVTGGSGFGNMGKTLSIANGLITGLIDVAGGKKNVDKACSVVKSPFGQAAIILGGIGISIAAIAGTPFTFGGTLAALAGGAAIGFGLSLGLSVAQNALTPMFIDMATGILINDTTFGEKAGDALISGSGYIMSTMAGAGGNAPLSPQDAVAYKNVQDQVLAQKAEDDRLTLSPFDASSRYTFMGRIVDQLVPYSAQSMTASDFANTSYSVVTRSLASIFNPSAFAKEATVDTYTQCDDVDYKQLNLATDPFCNPIRGIPPQYLNVDPDTIIDTLIQNQDIDEATGAPKSPAYKDFIANCIDRKDPLGYTGDSYDESKDGRDCFIAGDNEQTKAYWYLYQIDLRVIDGMENGFPDNAVCFPSTTSSSTGSATPSSVTKISDSEVKTLISSYGLPEPKADTSPDLIQYGEPVKGYQELLKQLQDNPKAGWAAQAMLNGEKTWASKGGSVKLYLNTTWVWFENGQSSWPDPYEMNCQNNTENTEATHVCPSADFQTAGYQGENRKNDYVEVFKKLYSESELSSVMKGVVQNSTNASKDIWNYNDPSNSSKSSYFNDLSSVSLSDIAPNKDFFDEKTQILTLILGKDPTMAAALNSFAVTDDDVLAHLGTGEGCGPGWGGYICKPARQQMANMLMALYMFDGKGPSASGVCKTSGSHPRGSGKGIAAIFDGTIPNISQEFGPTEWSMGEGAYMYTYATEYGMNPPGHTGIDYGVELDTKLYSPVAGTVKIAGGTPYFRSTDKLDGSGVSLPGTGELSIMLDNGDELILGHMHQIDVKVGDKVTAGQYVGLSGTENGAHVHVEYRIPDTSTSSGQRLVDPREYL